MRRVTALSGGITSLDTVESEARQFFRPNVSLFFLVLLFLCGSGYIYSVNANAVQGYRIRSLERDVSVLKEENARLRIREAEARSFEAVETTGLSLGMERTHGARYLDSRTPIALR